MRPGTFRNALGPPSILPEAEVATPLKVPLLGTAWAEAAPGPLGPKRSPFQLYRTEFNDDKKRQHAALGQKYNPVSRAAHDAVRTGWAALPDNEKQQWVRRSEIHNLRIDHERGVAKAAKRQRIAAAPADALAAGPAASVAASSSLATRSVDRMSAVGEAVDPDFPMTTEVLTQFLDASSVKGACASFADTVSRIEPPRGGECPRPAPYPKQCRGLCMACRTPGLLNLQRGLFKFLGATCKPREVPNDLLFQFSVYAGPVLLSVHYGLFCEGMGQYHRYKASSSFLMMRPDTEILLDGMAAPTAAEVIGMELRPRRLGAVAMDPSMPRLFHPYMGDDFCGELDILREAALSRRLLAFSGHRFPSRLEVQQLSHVPALVNARSEGLDIADLEVTGTIGDILTIDGPDPMLPALMGPAGDPPPAPIADAEHEDDEPPAGGDGAGGGAGFSFALDVVRLHAAATGSSIEEDLKEPASGQR